MQLQGLCGRYDGIAEMDMRQRNSDMEGSAVEVATSFSTSACVPTSLTSTAAAEVRTEREREREREGRARLSGSLCRLPFDLQSEEAKRCEAVFSAAALVTCEKKFGIDLTVHRDACLREVVSGSRTAHCPGLLHLVKQCNEKENAIKVSDIDAACGKRIIFSHQKKQSLNYHATDL